MVGKPLMKSLCKPDTVNMRLEVGELNIVVHTRPLSKQLDILAAKPLRFLELCGGASFSYKTLTNMGYEFELYHSIEYDYKACAVARAHSNGFVQHPQPQDLLAHPTRMKVTYTDILATTECGPWSRASGPVPPRGFNGPRAKLFLKACDIINSVATRTSTFCLRMWTYIQRWPQLMDRC